MKHYKLIKEFPGSPELKVLAIFGTHGLSGNCYQVKGKNGIYRYAVLDIENQSEFWEEIKEYPLKYSDLVDDRFYITYYEGQGKYVFKHNCNLWMRLNHGTIQTDRTGDFNPKNGFESFRYAQHEEYLKEYEILAFKRNGSDAHGCIKTKNSNGKFVWDMTNSDDTEERLLSCKGFDIHSVKRLEDGKVFTIGDTIVGFMRRKAIIASVSVNEAWMGGLEIKCGVLIKSICTIKHYSELLFTTEDGVDVFKGNPNLYGVCIKAYQEDYNIQKFDIEKGVGECNEPSKEHWKVFSTEELAKEYVTRQKPLLSIADVEVVTFNLINDNKLIDEISKGLKDRIKTKNKCK